jgi:uncharacterized protein (DUF2267 family)
MAEVHAHRVVQGIEADYERFIQTVQHAADLGWEPAERATAAVLETLAERLSAGEARDLAEQLPPQLGAWLATDSGAEGFEVDEFLRRVAEREEVDLETAERHVRAVFLAISRAVTPQEFDDMVAELPKTFARLLPRGEPVEVMPAELFLTKVADRAGVDTEAALRATNAVLETLAERISGGEVEDLLGQLPVPFHEPLRRGDAASNGAAMRMPLDEFVHLVAEREEVTPDQAREHTRAVFATLREAVTPKEWFDVTAQLPDEYTAVYGRP